MRAKLTSRRPHTAMSETMHLRDEHLSVSWPLSQWKRAGVRERSLAHVFDETFRVNGPSARSSSSRRHMRLRWSSMSSRRGGVVIGLVGWGQQKDVLVWIARSRVAQSLRLNLQFGMPTQSVLSPGTFSIIKKRGKSSMLGGMNDSVPGR
jgi:hypothetical protein